MPVQKTQNNFKNKELVRRTSFIDNKATKQIHEFKYLWNQIIADGERE